MQGWLPDKKKGWVKLFNAQLPSNEVEVTNFDDFLRHVVSDTGQDLGWKINQRNGWDEEPLAHIKVALASMGHSPKEIVAILGNAVLNRWQVVNKPFQDEYPGNREWNMNAAQLRFKPSQIENPVHPNWDKIYDHIGIGLSHAVQEDSWCRANGILTGSEYLKCWTASLFQYPMEPLPYLFYYGPQNSGKSIFHEALSLLLTKGYQRADIALTSQSSFNGELEGALLCVVEETNLQESKQAYNRIKDWVTSRHINIRHMYRSPYHIRNSTHWVQCANDIDACPIFPGDTRITLTHVGAIEPQDLIPKRKLIRLLESEAPDFLNMIMNIELPESPDRLNIPVIGTQEKMIAANRNKSVLIEFLDEHCVYTPGSCITIADFYERFRAWLDPQEAPRWSKQRITKGLPPNFPKGRKHGPCTWHYGNIAWVSDNVEPGRLLTLCGEYLEVLDD
jgi:hypothetical protein